MAPGSPATTCTLHRLDASRGVLAEAATWLVAHASESGVVVDLGRTTVVVPGRRAGHRLLELLLDRAGAGGRQLVPPTITTLGGLPELLYTPQRPLADEAVETLAWVKALGAAGERDRDLAAPNAAGQPHRLVDAAETLARMHRELAAIDLDFAEFSTAADTALPGFGDHARWQALARVERGYLDTLDAAGLWDRQTARRVAIDHGEIEHADPIVLVATADIDPLQRRMLAAVAGPVTVLVAAPPDLSATEFAAAFDDLGCLVPVAWQERPIPVPLSAIRLVDDDEAQAEAVVDWLRGFGGTRCADEITISVPDDALAPALEEKLAAAGVAGRYGTGRTVRRSSPWQLLAAVFDWLARGDFRTFATLLRAPDAAALVARRTGRVEPATLADAIAARHLPVRIDRAHLARAAERPDDQAENAAFLEVVAVVDAWLAPLAEAGAALDRAAGGSTASGTPLAVAWTGAIRDLFTAALGDATIDRDAPSQRVAARALATLGGRLSTLADIPDSLARAAGAAGMARLLLGAWGAEPVPPLPAAEAIEIVGWLEVPLDDAPALAITSAVEGVLPGPGTRDPFLPEPLRKALALEDAGRVAARDAWGLTLAACCRAELLVLVPRRLPDGSPAVPSRLLLRRSADEVAEAARAFFASVEPPVAAAPPAVATTRLAIPRPPRTPHAVPVMRVTEFKDYLACPYRYWLRHRLRLTSAGDDALELGPADFGTLLHECLDRFAKRAELVECTAADTLVDALSDILDTVVRFRYGRSAAPAVAVQAELARRRLGAFARVQAERAAAGWRVVLAEQHIRGAAIDVDGEPMMLAARIDRVDHNAESGRWQILDYKTSATGRTPHETHRKADRWVDLQLPLYRHLLPQVPGIEAHASVDVGYFNLPARLEHVGVVTAEWTDADYAAADETARHVIRQVRAGVFWPPDPAGDRAFPEFDPICQTRTIRDAGVSEADA